MTEQYPTRDRATSEWRAVYGRCEDAAETGVPRFAGRGELLIGVLMIETCFALPKFAHGQFLSVFDAIFSSIQNDIGSSLKTDQPDRPADAEALSDNGCAAGGHQPGPRVRRKFDQQLIAGR